MLSSERSENSMRLLKSIFLFASLVFAGGLQAQPVEPNLDSVMGAWRVTHPVNGHLFMIVRGNNLVSYFWEFWKGERVMRSEWKSFGKGVYFALESGDKLILTRTDAGVEVFMYNAGKPMAGEPDLRLFALRVNALDVGKWYKPKTTVLDPASDADDSSGFFGTWEVVSAQGLPYHIVIEEDRTAATNWPHSERGVDGMRGFWVRQGSELHIVWDTGHYDVLRVDQTKFEKIGYPPAVEISSVQPEPQPALKVDWFPQDPWRARYEAQRKADPEGPKWKSAKQASQFFRGDWKLLSSPGELTKLEMGRFGSIRGVRDNVEQKGTWRCTSDYALLRWDNGTTELLRPLGSHYITMLYSPLKNLDSIPDRVCPVEPYERWRLGLPKLFASDEE